MNRYMPYREPERDKTGERLSTLLAAIKLGLEGYNVYQSGQLGAERNALTAKEIEMRGDQAIQDQTYRTNELALRGRQVGVQEGQLEVDRGKLGEMQEANRLKAGESPDLKNFGAVSAKLAEKHLTNLGVKKDASIIREIQDMGTNPNVNNGEAYRIMKQNYHEFRKEMIETISEDYTNKVMKDDRYSQSKEGMQQQQTIAALEADEGGEAILSRFFPGTSEAIKRKEAASTAETLKANAEFQKGRYVQTDGGLYDTFEKKIITGTEKRFADKSPVSVGPGATLVDPSSNKPIYTNPNQQAGALRPVSVPEGGTLVDPQTGRVIHTSPKTPKEQTPTDKRTEDKSIAEAETKILANQDNEAVGGQVDFFNQYAKKPYTYVWKPGKLYGGSWEKTKLPTIKGKQVTAAEVYYTAEQNGITYDDVLRKIGAIK